MELVTGKIKKAKKIVVYGPEGIGKSTFASHFPAPVFIDTEGSTNELDVIRTKKPTSWQMLLDQVDHFRTHPGEAGTLIIDTADWAEILCAEHVCKENKWSGIENLDYGKGYVYVGEEWGRFLNRLDDVKEAGVNVVLTAHAILRKIEQPEESGKYDHWEMKLTKKSAALTKEWADMLLFANYKIHVVKDEKSAKGGKARGGKRVMYTSHHPCWDAKNRSDLPEEAEFDFKAVAHVVTDMSAPLPAKTEAPAAAKVEPSKEEPSAAPYKTPAPVAAPAPAPAPAAAPEKDATAGSQAPSEKPPARESPPGGAAPPHLVPLFDLMKADFVSIEQIQKIVAKRGYFPADTPIENYPPDFVGGVLVAAWPKVFQMICAEFGEPTPF
jgi:energy-coupling factor transporter ATP-binding protein EcfA2